MKSFNRTTRTVSTLAAIGLGGALVAIALPSSPAHASAPFAAYSATVNPANVKFSTTNVETVVFTNQSPLNSLDFATHATVSFPGFSSVSAPATVTDSAGNQWVVTVSQQTVSLAASNGGTPPTGTLSVPVTAKAPSTTRDVAIPTSMSGFITGVLGNFADVSNPDPVIGVYGDVKVCPAQTDCTSTTIGNTNQTSFTFVFHNTTGVPDTAYGRVETGPGAYACQGVASYVGDSQRVLNTNGTGSFTLDVRVDKTQVNAAPNNGAGTLVYCGHTPVERGSWTQADGTPAHLSADGLYYTGIFPSCTATRTLNCVTGNVHKNGQGDAVSTIQVVGGNHDPGGIMGLLT